MWEECVTEDFDKICRTCMKQSEDLVIIFESIGKYNECTLNEMMHTFIQLEIHKNDGLPVKMCLQCRRCVEEAYSFKLQVEKCHTLLHNILKQKISKNQNSVYSDVQVKLEVEIKDEQSNEYEDTSYGIQHSDDSEDGQPLSCMKKPLVGVFSCKLCDYVSASEETFLDHLMAEHRAECGTETTRGRGRPSHRHLVERKRKLRTNLENFANVTDMESNVQVKLEQAMRHEAASPQEEHSLELANVFGRKLKKSSKQKVKRLYLCNTCGKSFSRAGHLLRHRAKVHSEPQEAGAVAKGGRGERKERTFVCDVCSKAFYRQEQLDRHQKTHLPREKKYHCPHCPKKYDRQDKLKFHSRVHVANKAELESNFLCVYCGHGFSNSSNLIVHLRRHTGEKPYKCDICQKGFPRSTDLLNHRIIHTGERPCVCKVCGKAFSHQHKLVRHERIHTGDKPFKCNLCERAFAQSNDLTLHIRRHTGDKPFACNVCGDRFYLNTVLQSHKRTHAHYDAEEQAVQAAQRLDQSSVTG